MKKVWVFVLWLSGLLPMLAQTTDDGQGELVKFAEDTKLMSNGVEAWVVSMDLQWPADADATHMLPLQQELAQLVTGRAVAPNMVFEQALTRWLTSLGTPADTMPDMADSLRHYVECSVVMLARHDSQWVSFCVSRRETTGNGRLVAAVNRYFTYDIAADKVLGQEDMFNQNKIFGPGSEEWRIPFEYCVETGAVVADADYGQIDLRLLPKDVALVDDNLVLGLGGPSGHNNFSVVPLSSVNHLLTKKFRKFIAQ